MGPGWLTWPNLFPKAQPTYRSCLDGVPMQGRKFDFIFEGWTEVTLPNSQMEIVTS